MVSRPQRGHELGPGTRDGAVQHVHLEAVLRTDQRREQADGSGARDEHIARFPEGPLPDCLYLLPGLGDYCGGLEQDVESPSERSTFKAYSGSIRHRSDMNPSIPLIPRSVY